MNIEKEFDKYWEKYHKDDSRCSGDFTYNEIIDFNKYIRKKDANFVLLCIIIAFILGLIIVRNMIQ